MKEFKKIIGAKVVAADENTLYFDNGISVDVNEYETYFAKYKKELLEKSKLKYYIPSEIIK